MTESFQPAAPIRVLAIAGSLRAASINRAFCAAAARLAPRDLHVQVHAGLGDLPPFNPDLESAPPASVIEFRRQVGCADALLIASPEYAHGVSGVLKNALDWLVGFEGFVGVPAAVVNTSPRAFHAHEALLETLRTMSASIVTEASIAVPLLGYLTDVDAIAAEPAVSRRIVGALEALRDAARADVRRPRFGGAP